MSPNMIAPSMPARLFGSRRRIERPVMVLPQPLSPTMPTRSPGATSKSILRVACQTPCAVLKRMPRPRTEISGRDEAAVRRLQLCGGRRFHHCGAQQADAAALPISTARRCDSGIPILPMRPKGRRPRHARLLLSAKDRPRLRPPQVEFYSVCQNRTGNFAASVAAECDPVSAALLRRPCSARALRSETFRNKGWRCACCCALRLKAKTGWKRSPA